MTVDPRLEELARRSPNFGFLLAHEAVLVGYGAAAESMVLTDPNTSMIKSRQFGEQLVTALVTTFGIRIPADKHTQHKRLKVLLDQGVINKRVHSWFDAVRDTGNKAVHEGFAAQRDRTAARPGRCRRADRAEGPVGRLSCRRTARSM